MHPLFRLQCDREWTKSWKYRHQQQQSHVGCAISWWQNKDLKSIAWIMLRSIGSILIAQMTIDWCLNSGRNTTQLITEWNVTHSRQSLNVTYNGQYQEHVQLAKRAVVFSTLHRDYTMHSFGPVMTDLGGEVETRFGSCSWEIGSFCGGCFPIGKPGFCLFTMHGFICWLLVQLATAQAWKHKLTWVLKNTETADQLLDSVFGQNH